VGAHVVRRILSYAVGVRTPIAATITLLLAVAATYLVQGFLLADVLQALAGGAGVDEQRGRLLAVVGLVATRALLLYVVELVRAHTATATKVAVRDRGFAHLAALGPGHLAGDRTGEVVATLVDGVEALEGYYGRYVPALAAGILAPLGAVLALGWNDAWLALLVGLFIVVAVAGPQLWLGLLADRSEDRMNAYVGLGASVLDTLQGLTTLKAFGAGRRRRRELEQLGDRLITTWVREMAVALLAYSIFAAGIIGGMAAAAWVAGIRVSGGGLTATVGFLALLLSAEALRPIGVLAQSFHATYDAGTGVARLDALLALDPPAPPSRTAAAATATAAAEWRREVEPRVAFDHVTFAYPGADVPALDDVSFAIAPGETVAVVGASGAGKTTLVALLARFFDPQAGGVTIGGVDIRDLPLDQLRSLLAVVSQDTHLFSGTVRDNLLLARPDVPGVLGDPDAVGNGQRAIGPDSAELEADIVQAARAAGAHEFIAALPDGYATEIGEGGGRLSGGQRQRLAIARALLADAPILVLDEATASVDAAAEAGIQAALDALRAERTTLVIAHRLSTVRHADRIVVLAAGRVVEIGDHDSLFAAGGPYHRLVTAQDTGRHTAEEVHA
jgi:ABC-type multidrug transport system fused ATPase/permease subunit